MASELLCHAAHQQVNNMEALAGDCARFVIDAGRYDAPVLEVLRRDVMRLLQACGLANDGCCLLGVESVEVVANPAIGSGYAGRSGRIVEPVLASAARHDVRAWRATQVENALETTWPALQGSAGHRYRL